MSSPQSKNLPYQEHSTRCPEPQREEQAPGFLGACLWGIQSQVDDIEAHDVEARLPNQELDKTQPQPQQPHTECRWNESTLCDSAEQLRMVMQASRTGWWAWDLCTDTLTLDDQCKVLLGVPLTTQVSYEVVREHLRPEDRIRVDEALFRALAESGDYEVECAAVWQDGSVHHALLRGRSFHDVSGKPLRLMGVAVDITDRKRADEVVLYGKNRLETLIKDMPVGLAMFDRNMCYVRVSDRWLQDTGLGNQDVVGKSHYEVFPNLPEHWKEVHRRGLAGESLSNEEDWIAADGTRHSVHWMIHPWGDSGIDTGGVIIFSEDITERKCAAEALRQTAERFSLAQKAGRVGVFDWDLATNEAVWTPELEEIFGVSRGELENCYTGWSKRVHPDDLPRIEAQFSTWLSSDREEEQWEYRFLRHGDVRWITARGHVFRDATGRPLRMIGTNLDITERKQAEMDLERVSRILAEGQRIAHLGSWEYMAGTQHTAWSEEEFRIYGLDPAGSSPVYQDMLLNNIHPEDAGLLDQTFRQAMEDRTVYDLEHRIVRPDGSVRVVYDRAYPHFDGHGRLVKYIGATLDITERKRAEEGLKTLNETLEQRVAERTAEAEHRAAQLRALASEMTLTEQRERRRLAQVLHDHLQQMLAAAKMQVKIAEGKVQDSSVAQSLGQIDDLLDQSISESRSLTVELSPPVLFDRGLVGGLEWLSRRFLEKHRLPILLDLAADAEPADEGTRIFLFQAARELLFNTVKHAEALSAQICLSRIGEDRLRLVVSDDGRGFDPSLLNRTNTSGSFGLFSIRERLQLIGGHLEISSVPGEGTRMVIDVTGSRVSLNVKANPISTDLSASAEPEFSSPKIRVLLADDHPIVRQGLAGLMECQTEIELVGQAKDGQEALELARATRPDVILLDITMPRMTGFEATRCIKAELPETCVIGLSMHEGEDMARAMREAGATAYLNKSEAADTLIATILTHATPDRFVQCCS